MTLCDTHASVNSPVRREWRWRATLWKLFGSVRPQVWSPGRWECLCFHRIDKRFAPLSSNCCRVQIHWDITGSVLPWWQFAESLVFLWIAVRLLFGGVSPPGCLSSSLIFIWKTEPSRPAEWNSILLALKSVSEISPANITLIHVRPAEIYCWNCNMLLLFFFTSPFWKKEVCKLLPLQISPFFRFLFF